MKANRKRDRRNSERRGHWAEFAAILYLRTKGYRLLAHRFKTPLGEIDLVMRRGQVTAFVEVKARNSVDEGVVAVSAQQARRISAAADIWLAREPKALQGECRFDIVVVSPYLWPTHVPNAFEGAR